MFVISFIVTLKTQFGVASNTLFVNEQINKNTPISYKRLVLAKIENSFVDYITTGVDFS